MSDIQAGSSSGVRWNLFARELEDILAEHHLRLSQLDDAKDQYGAPLVHREKVRRLRRSLAVPAFTMLNPEELDRVVEALHFSDEERIRLNAALLATGVQMMLSDRIDAPTALRAAEETFIVFQRVLQAPSAEALALAQTRGRVAMSDETTELDIRFERALDTLDRANLALHMSQSSASFTDKIERAQQAHDGFRNAIRLLEKADTPTREDEAWQLWRTEAQQGRESAAQLLAQFGIVSHDE
jgi:hypothetical protein